MTPEAPPVRLALFLLLGLTSLVLGGCELLGASDAPRSETTENPTPPEDPPEPDPEPEPDPDPDEAYAVALPPEGATVTVPGVMAVLGGDVRAVEFSVDGVLQARDETAPFEWTFDPAQFPLGEHTLSLVAERTGATSTASVRILTAEISTGGEQPAHVFDAVRDLAGGEWYEIPDTHMSAVVPDPRPEGNPAAIMAAWSGGAFDTERNRLVVWGGGHADYSGNELYAFDMDDLRWSRVNDPSPFPSDDPWNTAHKSEHPDGAPISRHTYNHINYIPPPVDRFFSGGSESVWRDATNGDPHTRLFDFDGLSWEKKALSPVTSNNAFCAVDARGRVWQHGTRANARLAMYDPVADEWTLHADWGGWLSGGMAPAIDTERNELLAIGRGKVWVWDLDNPDQSATEITTTGATEILGEDVSIVYHPASDRYAAWATGGDVYTLDAETRVWKKHATTGFYRPGEPAVNGTYGRFRRVPSMDLLVLVNSISRNVFVYRLPAK